LGLGSGVVCHTTYPLHPPPHLRAQGPRGGLGGVKNGVKNRGVEGVRCGTGLYDCCLFD